ncbi:MULTISPECIES: DUF5053 domain-containing protein [Prevotella]|jgi:hypothetical protein|uniref:DUF5053 domain-containing protein n=1 Tax=Prevotella pectinovora TaxID=1602169 RepID=UPI00259939D5|nr:DUF5053 domain-containing protein [uncultured Prevotella sp.]
MENINSIFNELKSLMGKTDKASEERRDEISLWLKENSTNAEVKEAYNRFMTEGLAEVKSGVDKLREQIDSRYDLLPISYIAQHYFGKSKAWLYQRLNGNKVRGKVYTLNDEQKNIFNSAVKDIARQIGSVQLS